MNFKLVFFDGLLKIHLQLAPSLGTRVHILVIKADGLSSLRLDPIERQIRLVNQFVGSTVRSRSNRAALPILVTSGDSDPGNSERLRRLGADAYFVKPYSPAALRRTLEQLLHAS